MEPTTLLPLMPAEVIVVLDALVNFANCCESDDPGTAEMCDEIAKRVRGLHGLTSTEPEQWMKAIGIGRYNSRPQG